MGSKLHDDIQSSLEQQRQNLYHWLEATPDEKQEVQLASADQAVVEEHLHVISDSLEKIEHGTFGICEICHEPIRPTHNHVTVQERHYHARCYERTASKVIPTRPDGTRRGTS